MNLDEKAVQDVKDLFDIKYPESDEESLSTEGQSGNFADLEGDISSVISNMEDKGNVLEATKEEVVLEDETVEQKGTEEEVETIEDLIATSVEEAKALTTTQAVQEEESLQEETAQLQEELDSIVIEEGTIEKVIAKALSAEEVKELHEIEKQLKEVCADPELRIDMSHKVDSPFSIEDEDIDIIPCKDSEGTVRGEIRMKNVNDVTWDRKGKPVVSGGEVLWGTESPSELYDEFYAIKTHHINKFSGGSQLNFDKLYSELFNAKVDTSTEVLDQGILTHKMDEVMHCIERVAMIQVQINQQHFIWKRFVELLRGALARVQYLKPVLKQDGLILEHMGDVEFYSDRLQAIKDSADKVMKTLEKAFESLSRKVSIMLTVQSKYTVRMSPDAYGGSARQSYQPPVETYKEETEQVTVQNSELEDYDGFDVGATVAPVKPKAGEVAWGDIF